MPMKKETTETLWLPEYITSGAIVYDLAGEAYEVGGRVGTGANIRDIRPVEKQYADVRVRGGAQVLYGTEE